MDQDERTNGHQADGNIPDGVQMRPRAMDDAYSEEDVRREADDLASDMAEIGGIDNAGPFNAALSPGETPAQLFSRTQIDSEADAIKWANFFARRVKILRLDPEWANEPVVRMRSPGAVFGYFKQMFMMSYHRMARKEAVSVQTGMLSPDLLNEDAGAKEPFWRPARRRRY